MMAQSTLKLNQLILNNFGSFIGNHSIDLPENGLHIVLGENLDTNESSGAGKSSLVESIAYAFGYSSFSATDLQSWSWLTKEPMQVGMVINTPTSEIDFRRGYKPVFKQTNKDPVTSAKAVNEAINSLIGVRPEILKALTYRSQNQPGLFLSMTDQEKKSFLTELLGLQIYETETDRIVKIISDLEQQVLTKKTIHESIVGQIPVPPVSPVCIDISDLESRLHEIKDEILFVEGALNNLRELDQESINDQILREKEVNDQFVPNIKNLKSIAHLIQNTKISVPVFSQPSEPTELPRLKEKLNILRLGIAKARASHQDKIIKLRQDLKDARIIRTNTQKNIPSINAVTEKKKRLENEVLSLKNKSCPTCCRPWEDDRQIATLKDKALDICNCNDILVNIKDSEKLIETQDKQIAIIDTSLSLEEGIDPVPQKLKDGELDFTQKVANSEAEYKASIKTVKECHRNEIQLLEAKRSQELAEAQASVSKAETEYLKSIHLAQEMTSKHVKIREQMASSKDLLASLFSDRRILVEKIESAKARYQDDVARWEKEKTAYNIAKERTNNALAEFQFISTKLDQERDYLGCLRGFLGAVFDETLDRIAFLANQRLVQVPNVQSLTLRFISERETKTTKNIRQEIRPIVERDGHEIPLKRTSGGQYTAVELAVDLSLADVIAERTGIFPGWLILDEAFNGLPTKSKGACLDLLKHASETRLVLVIDHSTEFKEMFSSAITVRSSNGCSSFVI